MGRAIGLRYIRGRSGGLFSAGADSKNAGTYKKTAGVWQQKKGANSSALLFCA